jgi:hypothetical protein
MRDPVTQYPDLQGNASSDYRCFDEIVTFDADGEIVPAP